MGTRSPLGFMITGLVLDPYKEKRPSGLGRAVERLSTALKAQSPETQFLDYTRASVGGGRWWLESLRHAPQADCYVFFTPVMPLLWKPRYSIVIVHDLGYFSVPGIGVLRRLFLAARHKHACKKADRIVAVSQATKNDIVRRFKIPAQKITVIYDGANDFSQAAPAPMEGVPEKFFLFAGVVKERKNVHVLLESYAEYAKQGGTADLVIAGKTEGPYAERIKKEAAKLSGRVHFGGFVSDAQLAYLYKEALAFVYPSLAEGFGMSIVEAMSVGTPVIASTDPAIAEVVGDTALLVDAHDAHALAEAMRTLAADSALRSALSARARQRAQGFTWEKAAQELLALIRSTAD